MMSMAEVPLERPIETAPVGVGVIGGFEIIPGFPPNIDKIRAVLTEIPDTAIFTYGKAIYAPRGLDRKNKPLIAHEKVHMRQQRNAVEHWWDRYLADPTFRLWQEVPAYHMQYKVAKRGLPWQFRRTYLNTLAGHLSSPMYGSLVSLDKARHLIAHGRV